MSEKQSLDDRLSAHPEIKKMVESMLDVAEAKSGLPIRLDDIEEMIIRQGRAVEKELIREWAQEREKQTFEAARREGSTRSKGKKN